jgi:dTDP-4-dehydrorhamnose 3,5-epimerase
MNDTRGSALSETELSILEQTLKASVRDTATVTAAGKSLHQLIEGVAFHDVTTHTDERGSVFELYDERWNFHPDPLVFSYCFTIRPGYVKGWNLHKLHEDRYIVLHGELQLVLYDPRPESSTYGRLCKIVVSEFHRRLVTFPRNVWHVDYNLGSKDAVVVNFPTQPYDHGNPDKYRLPIDTPLIPYSFPPGTKGW